MHTAYPISGYLAAEPHLVAWPDCPGYALSNVHPGYRFGLSMAGSIFDGHCHRNLAPRRFSSMLSDLAARWSKIGN
ncbi:hypothetical protein Cob_v007391 [Colletotrichum orbiculare MAFF 240422]|uniref:Uncharacterized protein n=1 Tax=Colletotrichum orbiculare (strain 104-T / ATCC 96160 / CBS 514.97 / LARS 414 / MAFF 240422) TaxID=1213857 RepID=A0A484FMR8_COLOR|nr:hypothetical protein Cob_v007391 [Colletotrichum orbiculare MAFF 240422]